MQYIKIDPNAKKTKRDVVDFFKVTIAIQLLIIGLSYIAQRITVFVFSLAILGAFGAVSGALTAALPAAGFAIDVGLGVVEELVLNNMSEKPSNTLSKDIAISTGIDATSSISSNGSRLNKKNMQEFVETIPKMTKGNHPKVKGTAKKIYRRTGRKILRESGETFIEKSACNIFEVILKAIF